jgi:hypothetical protein
MRRIAILPVILFLFAPTALEAQPAAAAQGAEDGDVRGIRVFLDCEFGCDFDYLRREVTFVNYVRDRADADVHVLVTRRQSGGGSEWTFNFIGAGDFYEGRDITLEYFSSATDTQDEVREGYTRVMRAGLLNYAIDSPLGPDIDVRFTPTAGTTGGMATREDDPWNFWVFRAEMSVDVREQQRTKERNFQGSFSADRTTEQWKIRTQVDAGYNEDEFELNDGGVLVSDSRDWELSGQVVRSLGPHWGASIRAAGEASTFRNENRVISAAPGIEYSVFPYDDSSRRALTLTYEVGYSDVEYEEETLFDVIEETLVDHQVVGRYSVTQPWGNAFASASVSQFLNETSQYRAELNGQLEFRITRGLSVNVRGEYSLVRDQRFIPKADISDEEVLLRRRALATDFEHRISVGFSYTFGSIFNNVVNPRFGGGRRGGGNFFF